MEAKVQLTHRLLELDKVALVNFIIDSVPKERIEASFWKDDENQLRNLKAAIALATESASKVSEDEENGYNPEGCVRITQVFGNILRIFDIMKADLRRSVAEKPFYVLEALNEVATGLWSIEPGPNLRLSEATTHAIEEIDRVACSAVQVLGDRQGFTRKDERILLLIAKHFSLNDNVKQFQDFGQLRDIELHSGPIARELLDRIRQNGTESRKRVRLELAPQIIDMSNLKGGKS